MQHLTAISQAAIRFTEFPKWPKMKLLLLSSWAISQILWNLNMGETSRSSGTAGSSAASLQAEVALPQRDPMIAAPVAKNVSGPNAKSPGYIKGVNNFQETGKTLSLSTPLIVPGTSFINVQPDTTAAVNSSSSAATSRYTHSSPLMGESVQSATTDITTGTPACTFLISSVVPAGKAVPENMRHIFITHKFVQLSDLLQCRIATDYELRLNSEISVPSLCIQLKKKKTSPRLSEPKHGTSLRQSMLKYIHPNFLIY